MNKKTKSLSAFLILMLSMPAFASDSLAPMKLDWGMSKNEVEKKLKDFDYVTPRARDDVLILNKVDSVNFLYQRAALYFANDGLQYAQVKGKSFSNDPTGKIGFTFYHSEKKRLTEQYPDLVQRSFEFMDTQNTYDKNSFYQCLNYLDCGKFKTYFTLNGKPKILLSLEKENKDSGYIMYTFQGDEWNM